MSEAEQERTERTGTDQHGPARRQMIVEPQRPEVKMPGPHSGLVSPDELRKAFSMEEKLEDIRWMARRVFGATYDEETREARELIQDVMIKSGTSSPLGAALAVANGLKKLVREDGTTGTLNHGEMLRLFPAALDLVEAQAELAALTNPLQEG